MFAEGLDGDRTVFCLSSWILFVMGVVGGLRIGGVV